MIRERKQAHCRYFEATAAILVALVAQAPAAGRAARRAARPVLSEVRGFKSKPFSLRLSSATPGARIRYTLDGSAPTEQHGTQGSSLRIEGSSVVRAIAYGEGLAPSPIATVTYIFLDQVVQQGPNAAGIPDGPPVAEHGATVYGWGSTEMDPHFGAANAATIRSGLEALPTLAITTDLAHMFGDELGIMQNAFAIKWNSIPDPLGQQWERPISVEWIEADGTPGFQIDCGVRPAGNEGRMRSKRSFSLRFRAEYGAATLRYPLIPDYHVRRFDELRLDARREPEIGPYTMRWLSDLQGAMSGESQRGRMAHLYINGAYWGIYHVTEIAKEGLGEAHFGGDKAGWISEREDGPLRRVLGPIADLKTAAGYAAAKSRIAMRHLADYFLLVIWVNHATWDNEDRLLRNPERGIPLHAYVWDKYFVGFDRSSIVGTSLMSRMAFHSLIANPDFGTLFADRARRHFLDRGLLTEAKAIASFRAAAAEVRPAFYAELARWRNLEDSPRFLGDVDMSDFDAFPDGLIRDFFTDRTSHVLAYLKDLKLIPTLEAPSFSHRGGVVSRGANLTVSGKTGRLYYTTDGVDPRIAVSGKVYTGAKAATSLRAALTIEQTVHVKARVRDGDSWSALTEGIFSVAQESPELRVTEIMYHPPETIGGGETIAGDDLEFIELKNTGATPVVLTGLATIDGLTFRQHEPKVLPSGGFFLLVSNPRRFAERYPGVHFDGVYAGTLSNEGEQLRLALADGTTVSVEYDDAAPWPLAADGAGFSAVPIGPRATGDPDDGASWRASTALGGSPGADDPAPPEVVKVVVNEVLTHTDPPLIDAVELHNPTAAPAAIGGWYLSDDNQVPKKFRIPAGSTIPAGGYLVLDESAFNAMPGAPGSFALSSLGEGIYLYSANTDDRLTGYSHGFRFGAAENGVSFGRHVISTGQERFPAQLSRTLGAVNSGPRIGPLVINEIMYHPAGGQAEFVELLNVSDERLTLYVPSRSANTWRLKGMGGAFGRGLEVPPGGMLLLAGSDPQTFRQQRDVPAEVPIVGPVSAKLDNAGERLTLQKPETVELIDGVEVVPYITVDRVTYDDEAPWPVEADGRGQSLERRDALIYADDPANWAASPTTGGSPGRRNGAAVQAWCAEPNRCNDGVACTVDSCDEGTDRCIHAADDASCDDGLGCNGVESCQLGVGCAGGAPPDCDDGKPTTRDTCDESSGCLNEEVPCDGDADCDDLNPCTEERCAEDQCTFQALPECCRFDGECQGERACTADRCRENACESIPVPGCCIEDQDCEDSDPCTSERCHDGACTLEDIVGCCVIIDDCDDGDPCTRDLCQEGACVNLEDSGCGAGNEPEQDTSGCGGCHATPAAAHFAVILLMSLSLVLRRRRHPKRRLPARCPGLLVSRRTARWRL